MDIFKRSQRKFRSLPRSLASAIRSLPFERIENRRSLINNPYLQKRRNGISVDSYSELRKSILHRSLPTKILQRYPTKEFPLNACAFLVASSTYYILVLTNNCSTLILFNKDKELYRIDLSHLLISVNDLCWSSNANLFYLGGYSVYTFNPSKLNLFVIKQIEIKTGEWIVSITIDKNDLYLLYSSNRTRIERRSILFNYQIDKQWFAKDFLRSKDFLAQCIRVNQANQLGLTIKQKTGQWRIDVFETVDFKRIIRCVLSDEIIPGMRNCLLMPYEQYWLAIHNCTYPKKIILIDGNGKIQDKLSIDVPNGLINLCLLDNHWIVMICKDKLKLYSLQ